MNFSFVDYDDFSIQDSLDMSSVCEPDLAPEDVRDSIVTAAVLTSTAFRLRDDLGLICALRLLANAVEALDGDQFA